MSIVPTNDDADVGNQDNITSNINPDGRSPSAMQPVRLEQPMGPQYAPIQQLTEPVMMMPIQQQQSSGPVISSNGTVNVGVAAKYAMEGHNLTTDDLLSPEEQDAIKEGKRPWNGPVQKYWPYWLWQYVKVYITGLPHEDFIVLHEKNVRLFWFLSIWAYAIMFGIFLYFFINGILSGMKSKYISMDLSSGICSEIGTSIELTQYASKRGSWQGFRNFKYQEAKYIFTFQGFDGSSFKQYINDVFTKKVIPIGEDAKKRPFFWNILTWATYTDYDFRRQGKEEVVTTFKFAGETKAIFERDEYTGAFGNDDGTCTPRVTVFDGIRKTFTLRWSMVPGDYTWNDDSNTATVEVNFDNYTDPFAGTYSSSSFTASNFDCDEIMPNPKDYGFDPNYGPQFDLTMDLDTFLTAVSLNLKIINSTNLESSGLRYKPADSKSSYPSFFDPQLKGMQPLYCTYNAEAAGQKSKEYDDPGSSDNDETDDYEMDDYVDSVSYRRRLQRGQLKSQSREGFFANRRKMSQKRAIGADFYTNGDTQTESMELSEWEYYQQAHFELQNSNRRDYCYLEIGSRLCLPALVPLNEQCMTCDVNNPPAECNQFNLMATCLFHDNSTDLFNLPVKYDQPTLYSHIQKAAIKLLESEDPGNAYDFCDNECSLFAVGIADDYDFKINDFNHQLKPMSKKDKGTYAHCNDTFTIQNWERLATHPPTPLIRVFYECLKPLDEVITDSFGIASANAGSFGAMVCTGLIIFVYAVLENFPGIRLPDDEEKVQILERLRLDPG